MSSIVSRHILLSAPEKQKIVGRRRLLDSYPLCIDSRRSHCSSKLFKLLFTTRVELCFEMDNISISDASSNDTDDIVEEMNVDLEHGVPDGAAVEARRSRESTNFLYRYDSLRTAGRNAANNALNYVQSLIETSLLLLELLYFYAESISNGHFLPEWFVHSYHESHRDIVLRISWIDCCVTRTLLNVHDAIYYSVDSRPPVIELIGPVKKNMIDSLTQREADDFTGFSVANLRRLMLHWRVPAQFSAPDRSVFTGGYRHLQVACLQIQIAASDVPPKYSPLERKTC
jgi:hypothetical protein